VKKFKCKLESWKPRDEIIGHQVGDIERRNGHMAEEQDKKGIPRNYETR
jgi:hypothetical protein